MNTEPESPKPDSSSPQAATPAAPKARRDEPATQHSRRTILATVLPAIAAVGAVGWSAAPRPASLGEMSGDEALADALAPHLTDHRAVAVGLLQDGEPRFAGFGADEQTEFEIGSVTKTMTGALLMNAVDRGDVTLETTVAEVLGDEASGSPIAEVTLGGLASHTSGMPRLGSGNPFAMLGRSLMRKDPYRGNPQDVIDEALGIELSGAGEFTYSNLGVALLGQLLARLSSASYTELLEAQVFEPLGMDASWTPYAVQNVTSEHPRGHDSLGRRAGPWTLEGEAPSGGVRSTASDMLTYLQAAMAGDLPGGTHLESLGTTSGEGTVGVSWFVNPGSDGTAQVWHNGMTGGFASFCGWREDGDVGVVILTDTATEVDGLGVQILDREVAE